MLRGKLAIARDQLRVIERKFVVDEAASERDLDAVETELRRERDGLRFGAEFEVPIGDADAELRGRGPQDTAAKAGGCCRTEQVAAGELRHDRHCIARSYAMRN